MELVKDDTKGKVYQANGFKIFYRNKNTISGDNSKNQQETIHLIIGHASITLESATQNVEAPKTFKFPKETYHKIEAITDIVFLVFEE